MPRFLKSLLQDSLSRFAEQSAINVNGSETSYQDFFGPVVVLCDNIEPLISGQKTIGVLATKSLAGYQCIATAFLSGKTYVPLNPSFPDAKNIDILARSGTSVLLADEKSRELAMHLQHISDTPMSVLVLESLSTSEQRYEWLGAEPGSLDASSLDTHELAYILFTSGSTGKPKGVPISDTNISAYIGNINGAYNFSSEDRFSQFFEFTFDLSVHDILVCWSNGACLCIPSSFDQLMPLQFAKKRELTVWFSVPSLGLTAKDLMRDKFTEFRLESLRYSFFCGEALPQTLAEDWSHIASNAPVVNLYGPTEATIAFTAHEYQASNDSGYAVVPIGQAFGNNHVDILAQDGSPCDKGEVCLGGDQVFSGYWQADALTADAFVAGKSTDGKQSMNWYKTGDVGSRRDDKAIVYHGRSDRQVQVNGFRVELQEVEHAFRSVLEGGTVAVIAFPVNSVGEPTGLTAFVSADEYADDLVERCSDRLASYMLPQSVIALDDFPYNASGKLDYKQLTLNAAKIKDDAG